jgi:hypothetical protein
MAYMAYCTVDTKIILFHGADSSGALDSVMILETSADPAVPITQACLKEGAFFTNGIHLCMLLPPLLSPNVVLAKAYMTRVFSLETGDFLYDMDDGEDLPGHAATYDPVNNLIWTIDAKAAVIRRWANDDPAPMVYDGTDEPTEASVAAEPIQDLSLRLLIDLERFALYSLPPVSSSTTYDARRCNYDTAREDALAHDRTLNEPFSTEMHPQTFMLLGDLMQTSVRGINQHFEQDQTRGFYTRALETCLKLLALNMQRLASTLEFTLDQPVSLDESSPASDQRRLGDVMFEALTGLVADATRWQQAAIKKEGASASLSANSDSSRYRAVLMTCYEIMSSGLPFFLRHQPARIEWFLGFLRSHLPSPAEALTLQASAAASPQAACLRLVLDRLIFNRRATHDLLESSSELEGALPLQVVAVYEPKLVSSLSSSAGENVHTKNATIGLLPSAQAEERFMVENLVDVNTEEVYVARSSRLVHVLLSHRIQERLIQPTLLRIRLTAQPSNTADVRGMRRARNLYNGLVFLTDATDFTSVVTNTAAFDECTEESYNAWRAGKIARKEPWDLSREPVGYFQFDTDADLKAKEKLKLQSEELAARMALNTLPSLETELLDLDSAEKSSDSPPPPPTTASSMKMKKKLRELALEPVWLRDAAGQVVLRRAAGKYVLLKLLKAQPEIIKAPVKTEAKKKPADDFGVGPLSWGSANVAAAAAKKDSAAAPPKTPLVSTADEPCIMVKCVVVYGVEADAEYINRAPVMHLLPSASIVAPNAVATPSSTFAHMSSSSVGFPVLRFLLDRASEYALAQLSDTASGLGCASAACLSLLQLFQADLVSRAAKCLQAQTLSPLYASLPPPAFLLLEYTQALIDASNQLLDAFAQKIDLVDDEVQVTKQLDLLATSFLRTLLPSLLTSLVFFASNVVFSLRLLPNIVLLLQSLDRLSLSSSAASVASSCAVRSCTWRTMRHV